jgi:hypothetical protein
MTSDRTFHYFDNNIGRSSARIEALMKHLIVLRHGACEFLNKKEVLSPNGIYQMHVLACAIERHTTGLTGSIYTSPEKRAVQSAKILSDYLGWDLKLPILFLGHPGLEDFPLIQDAYDPQRSRLVPDADPSDIVVVVTHMDRYEPVAEAAIHTLRLSPTVEHEFYFAPRQGKAAWFDLEQRTARII